MSTQRKPGRRATTSEVRRVNTVVCNGRMVDVFDALCFLEGRRPHELVHDIVLEHLRAAEADPHVATAIRLRRAHNSPLRLVTDA